MGAAMKSRTALSGAGLQRHPRVPALQAQGQPAFGEKDGALSVGKAGHSEAHRCAETHRGNEAGITGHERSCQGSACHDAGKVERVALLRIGMKQLLLPERGARGGAVT